jgi:hypothetical protein
MIASRLPRPGLTTLTLLLIAAAIPLATVRAEGRVEVRHGGVIAAIDAAVAAGEVTEAEGLLEKVRLVKGSAALSKRFASAESERIKCGTSILLEAREKLPVLPVDIQDEIRALLSRPTTETFLDTAHFRVHYDTSGPNVIYGWPATAYRDSVVAACEKSWNFYHVTNGWQIPPSDGTAGGNALIDCYVTDAGGSYGWTQSESAAPRWPDDWTAFFVVDHAYDPPFPDTDRTLPMKITVAHEYHHVVQYGYTSANKWWMENVSTFMEDEVYDAINDNYQYLPGYTNYPYLKLSTLNSSHEYACFVWPTMIKEKWSHDVIRQVFACTASGTSIYACFDNVLAPFGTDFGSTLAEWGIWNFYTSTRNDGNHYLEASGYSPQMAYDQQFTTYPQTGVHPSVTKRPDGMGQSVMRLVRDAFSGHNKLTLTFDGPSCTRQVMVVVKDAGQAVFHEYYMNLDFSGNGSLDIPYWNNSEYGHMIVQMSSACASPQDYVFDAVTTVATGVEHPPLYTRTVRLDQNEPNPFGPQTRIGYALDSDSDVHLSVFDAGGRQVRTLVEAGQSAGNYQVRWDGRDDAGSRVAPGVYFYRLQAGGRAEVRKLVVAN